MVRPGVDDGRIGSSVQVNACTSGNPSLGAEESEIMNFGLSWRPSEGLSVDLDYQEIEYIGRISTLITSEVTRRELNAFLAANNLTTANFRPATNPADAAKGIAWALANPNELIERDAQRLPIAGGLETRVDDPFRRQFYMSMDFDLGG